MAKVSVTELRQNLPAYLAKVRKGEEIEVAVHGKVIARGGQPTEERPGKLVRGAQTPQKTAGMAAAAVA